MGAPRLALQANSLFGRFACKTLGMENHTQNGNGNGQPHAAPAPVELGQAEDWGQVSIHGFTFDVEILRANRQLAAIERRHPADANECLACGAMMGADAPRSKDPEGGPDKLLCGCCKADAVRMSQALLDDVIALLLLRYAVPRCSNDAAAGFYNLVVDRMEAAKKKIGPTPESAIGSGSIPQVGAI